MQVLSQKTSELQTQAVAIPTSSVVTVTPALAKKWLEAMVENQRKPSESVVLKYSRAMKAGSWILSSPISFNSDGFLIDGQHRLLAVIKSGCSIDFLLIENLPVTAINGMDMGTPRTAVNLANLQGLSTTPNHFSILNCCFYGFGSDALPPSLSKQEQIMHLTKHFPAVDFASKRCKSGGSGYISYAPFLAPVARAYYSENHLRLEQFLKVLHTGFTISSDPNDDSAAIALRNLYHRERGATALRLLGGSTKRTHDFRKATAALKNFIMRTPIKMVKETSVNAFPVADFDAWWKKSS